MLEHKHLIVRAKVLNPPNSSQMEMMRKWFVSFVEKIEMKILDGPYLKYLDVVGNRGFTGVCIIETSHIAMHVWDEESPGLMQFDVYTCGNLNIRLVFEALEVFNPIKIEYKYLDREHGLFELDCGKKDLAVEYLR